MTDVDGSCGAATMLALHGSAEAPAQWNGLVAAAAGVREVVAPDIHAVRARAVPAGRLLDGNAGLGDALLRDAGRDRERLHLVGHGFGGALALRLAVERPERVASLALVDPLPLHLLRFGSLADRLAFGDTLYAMTNVLRAVGRRGNSVAMARYVDHWYGEGNWSALPDSARERIAAHAPHVGRDIVGALHVTDGLDRYRGITSPTLVLCGRQSPTATRRVAALVAILLPAARLQALDRTGHAAPSHQAARVSALILAHAEAHEPGAVTALAA